MKRRIGFTLVELLVVISIIGLLASIMIPSLGSARELARRRVCLSHISVLVKGMRTYSETVKGGQFPSTHPKVPGTSYIGCYWNQEWGPNDSGRPGSQLGQSRSLFWLARHEYTGMKCYTCPSTRHEMNEDIDPDEDYDFRSETDLDYSYQDQKTSADGTLGYITSHLDRPDLVVLADRNPVAGPDVWADASGSTDGRYANPSDDSSNEQQGGYDEKAKNSFNHRQDGQNIGYANGQAKFVMNPYVGPEDLDGERDNIWCYEDASGNDQITSPGSAYPRRYLQFEGQRDSFLWP